MIYIKDVCDFIDPEQGKKVRVRMMGAGDKCKFRRLKYKQKSSPFRHETGKYSGNQRIVKQIDQQ
ncbi:hypothetical protein EVY29_12660 [Klebsiella pneumoniae]|nr:hypothetical protein EVY29_12660 [Klebsiella pneumoniae]